MKKFMLLLILGISLVTYVSTVAYVGWTMGQKSIADAKKLADLGAVEQVPGLASRGHRVVLAENSRTDRQKTGDKKAQVE